MKQAEMEKKAATGSGAGATGEMSLLQLSDEGDELTEAEKAAAAAAESASAADQGVVELPPVEPFQYKGCQC